MNALLSVEKMVWKIWTKSNMTRTDYNCCFQHTWCSLGHLWFLLSTLYFLTKRGCLEGMLAKMARENWFHSLRQIGASHRVLRFQGPAGVRRQQCPFYAAFSAHFTFWLKGGRRVVPYRRRIEAHNKGHAPWTGCLALKDHDFWKVPLKEFIPIKYQWKIPTSTANSTLFHFSSNNVN